MPTTAIPATGNARPTTRYYDALEIAATRIKHLEAENNSSPRCARTGSANNALPTSSAAATRRQTNPRKCHRPCCELCQRHCPTGEPLVRGMIISRLKLLTVLGRPVRIPGVASATSAGGGQRFRPKIAATSASIAIEAAAAHLVARFFNCARQSLPSGEHLIDLYAQPLGRRYPLRHGRRLLPQIFQIFEGTYVSRTYLHRRELRPVCSPYVICADASTLTT